MRIVDPGDDDTTLADGIDDLERPYVSGWSDLIPPVPAMTSTLRC
jgi:hypothetical protein